LCCARCNDFSSPHAIKTPTSGPNACQNAALSYCSNNGKLKNAWTSISGC
jgi:hypothetical protein